MINMITNGNMLPFTIIKVNTVNHLTESITKNKSPSVPMNEDTII